MDSGPYCVKFADDTKIGREIVDIQDSYKLHAGIDNLVQSHAYRVISELHLIRYSSVPL